MSLASMIETDHKLRLFNGDTIAAVFTNDEGNKENQNLHIRFGCVSLNKNYQQAPDTGVFKGSKASQNGTSKCLGRVLWNNKVHKRDLDLSRHYMVVNRKFKVGQRVRNSRDHTGEIVGVLEFATLQEVHTSEIINTEVPFEQLSPVTPFFCGVQIEYLGWIGTITGVDRLFQTEFNGSQATGTQLVREPIKNVINNPARSWKGPSFVAQVNRQYPFTTKTGSAYYNDGQLKIMYFRPFHGHQAVKDDGWNNVQRILSGQYSSKSTDRITATKVESIAVAWLGRIPSIQNEPNPPPETLTANILPEVRRFFIHPALYAYKKGICFYDIKPEDVVTSFSDWNSMVVEHLQGDTSGQVSSFSKLFQGNDGRPDEKRVKLGEKEDGKTKLAVVQVHIKRDCYQIKWDHLPLAQNNYGDELEPERIEDVNPDNFLSPLVYVRKYGTVDEDAYGVVLGRVQVDGVEKLKVRWLTVNISTVKLDDVTELESSLDIISHLEFNKLRVGSHVYLDVGKYGAFETSGFLFGTVKKINRSFFGKVLIYCAIEFRDKWLWPFQLKVIDYTSGIKSL